MRVPIVEKIRQKRLSMKRGKGGKVSVMLPGPRLLIDNCLVIVGVAGGEAEAVVEACYYLKVAFDNLHQL